jgi:hypothetical protein
MVGCVRGNRSAVKFHSFRPLILIDCPVPGVVKGGVCGFVEEDLLNVRPVSLGSTGVDEDGFVSATGRAVSLVNPYLLHVSSKPWRQLAHNAGILPGLSSSAPLTEFVVYDNLNKGKPTLETGLKDVG